MLVSPSPEIVGVGVGAGTTKTITALSSTPSRCPRDWEGNLAVACQYVWLCLGGNCIICIHPLCPLEGGRLNQSSHGNRVKIPNFSKIRKKKKTGEEGQDKNCIQKA